MPNLDLDLSPADLVTIHDRQTMLPVDRGTVTHVLAATIVVQTTAGWQRVFRRRDGHGVGLADDLVVRRAPAVVAGTT
jgi:hypothetical protein